MSGFCRFSSELSRGALHANFKILIFYLKAKLNYFRPQPRCLISSTKPLHLDLTKKLNYFWILLALMSLRTLASASVPNFTIFSAQKTNFEVFCRFFEVFWWPTIFHLNWIDPRKSTKPAVLFETLLTESP